MLSLLEMKSKKHTWIHTKNMAKIYLKDTLHMLIIGVKIMSIEILKQESNLTANY